MKNETLFLTNIIFSGICTMISIRFGSIGLACWATAQAILANIFVLKQIILFGLNVTASDVFAISGMFSVALLQEFHGKTIAQKTIFASSLVLLLFALVSQLHLAYIPSDTDFAQSAYKTLFGPNIRIIAASIFAYWVSLQVNVYLMQFLQQHYANLKLQLRTIITVCIAQFVDTVLFAMLGLYGLLSHIAEIIMFSMAIKIITLLLLSYCVVFAKKICHNYRV